MQLQQKINGFKGLENKIGASWPPAVNLLIFSSPQAKQPAKLQRNVLWHEESFVQDPGAASFSSTVNYSVRGS